MIPDQILDGQDPPYHRAVRAGIAFVTDRLRQHMEGGTRMAGRWGTLPKG